MNYNDYVRTQVFLKNAEWEETFAFLPHRCRISKRWIWLKKAYKGVATYTGPGTPVTETHWHESGEHIKWLLTKPDNLIGFMSDIRMPSVLKMMPVSIAQDIVSVQPMQSIDLSKLTKKDEK